VQHGLLVVLSSTPFYGSTEQCRVYEGSSFPRRSNREHATGKRERWIRQLNWYDSPLNQSLHRRYWKPSHPCKLHRKRRIALPPYLKTTHCYKKGGKFVIVKNAPIIISAQEPDTSLSHTVATSVNATLDFTR
jgi:hypothetical protein